MSVALQPGWQETPAGLAVPSSAMTRPETWTPEFRAFMGAVEDHLPEVQEWISKSLAVRAPQTQPVPFYQFASAHAGIKEPFASAGLSQETLRTMAYRCPITSAIVGTLVAQVADYAQVPQSKTDAGFKITLRDPEAQPSKEERDSL
jgi:hypothetical protein